MSDSKGPECKDPAGHGRHICQLPKQGRDDAVVELMKTPEHTCLKCNAPANNFENLCKELPPQK